MKKNKILSIAATAVAVGFVADLFQAMLHERQVASAGYKAKDPLRSWLDGVKTAIKTAKLPKDFSCKALSSVQSSRAKESLETALAFVEANPHINADKICIYETPLICGIAATCPDGYVYISEEALSYIDDAIQIETISPEEAGDIFAYILLHEAGHMEHKHTDRSQLMLTLNKTLGFCEKEADDYAVEILGRKKAVEILRNIVRVFPGAKESFIPQAINRYSK